MSFTSLKAKVLSEWSSGLRESSGSVDCNKENEEMSKRRYLRKLSLNSCSQDSTLDRRRDEEEMNYNMSNNSSDDNIEDIPKRRPKKTKAIPNKTKVFRPYDTSEDELILDYVFKSGRLDQLKGNAVWEEAEKQNICDGRSWQSMKERFRRYIMPDIDSYVDNKRLIQTLKECYYLGREGEANRKVLGPSTGYTADEDNNILKHIISKRGFDLVKGNKFWRQMESEFKRKKIMDRSWQSLKERYLKRITPNLNKYEIDFQFAKQILNSITRLSITEKNLILNKCKKCLTNQRNKRFVKRRSKPQLVIQEEPEETPVMPLSNRVPEVKTTTETNNSIQNMRTSKRRKVRK